MPASAGRRIWQPYSPCLSERRPSYATATPQDPGDNVGLRLEENGRCFRILRQARQSARRAAGGRNRGEGLDGLVGSGYLPRPGVRSADRCGNKDCYAVLVVWTPHSVESRWVPGEAREGVERGILVPVRFDRADLPIDVRTLHTTDFDDWGEDPQSPQAQEVVRALGAMIARKSAARAVTEISGLAPSASAPGPARVSICVLPFANMSGDPEQEYFSDGITEDIITDLSKVSALAVTSRNSAFVFKGKHVDVLKVARELKVDHVLEGSVRKAGGRVRITAHRTPHWMCSVRSWKTWLLITF
jgi:TolB-like protein